MADQKRLEAIEARLERITNAYRIYRYRGAYHLEQPQVEIYVPLKSTGTEFEYRIVLTGDPSASTSAE